ncbi:MAG: P-II family nitrogen regulator [Acidobacteriota bacterium]
MKEVKAIIRPERLYPVLVALRDIPEMPGILTSELRVFPKGHPATTSRSHGIDALDSFTMLKLQCIVADDLTSAAVDAIRAAARTGTSGDGKIFIYSVSEAIAIGPQRGDEQMNPIPEKEI